jgi:hypothetical protein
MKNLTIFKQQVEAFHDINMNEMMPVKRDDLLRLRDWLDFQIKKEQSNAIKNLGNTHIGNR